MVLLVRAVGSAATILFIALISFLLVHSILSFHHSSYIYHTCCTTWTAWRHEDGNFWWLHPPTTRHFLYWRRPRRIDASRLLTHYPTIIREWSDGMFGLPGFGEGVSGVMMLMISNYTTHRSIWRNAPLSVTRLRRVNSDFDMWWRRRMWRVCCREIWEWVT